MSLPHLKLEVPHTRRDLPWPWVASRTGEPCMGHSLPSAKQPRSLDPEGPEARARLQQELEAMAEQVGQLRENLAQISWGLAWAGLASGIPPRLERGVPPGLAQLLKEELGAVVDAVLRGVVPPPRCRPPGDQAEALALVVRKPPVAPLLPHSGLDGPPCQPPISLPCPRRGTHGGTLFGKQYMGRALFSSGTWGDAIWQGSWEWDWRKYGARTWFGSGRGGGTLYGGQPLCSRGNW